MCSITWHRLPPHSWMTPGGNAHRRKILKEEDAIPTISEIESQLGSPMAQIFFQSMADYNAARDQLGLGEQLKGTLNDLWVSPSDVLTGKVLLSEPRTPRCLQALTHEAILYFGRKHEMNVEEETKRRIKQAVDSVIEKMKKEKELAVEDAIYKTKLLDQEKYSAMIDQLQQEVDGLIKKATEELEQKLLAEAKAEKENAIKDLHECMKNQILAAVEEREKYLTKKFNFKLMWEGNRQYEFYREKLHEQQHKWSALFNDAQKIFKKELTKLKYELEAKHITDVLHVYQDAVAEINKTKKIMDIELQKCLEEKLICMNEKHSSDISDKFEMKCKDEKIKILKDKLYDLVIQFQQFIQMTLHGNHESQIDFFLSLEKILYDERECGTEQPPIKASKSKETIETIMAIIFEIILSQYCTKETSSSSIFDNSSIKKKVNDTFEKRVERERAANRAIDLVITGTKMRTTANKMTEEKEHIDCMAERVIAVKQLLEKHPSIMQVFLDTKDAVDTKINDIKNRPSSTVEEEQSTEQSKSYPKLSVCRSCTNHQRKHSISDCVFLANENVCYCKSTKGKRQSSTITIDQQAKDKLVQDNSKKLGTRNKSSNNTKAKVSNDQHHGSRSRSSKRSSRKQSI